MACAQQSIRIATLLCLMPLSGIVPQSQKALTML